MFSLKKLLFISALILNYSSYSQTLVINEFSNGPSGVQEYIEFIAIDTSSLTNTCSPCIDIRGWIIDDNNGYHGSSGIASGCNRFSNDTVWSCIPLGTMITIYNGVETNVDMPADDLNINDGNCRLVVPIENTVLFESNPNTPGAVFCDYPDIGWTSGGVWSRIGMRNAGDCIRLVNLDGCEIFSLSYGDISLNSTIYFEGSGIDDVFYLNGNDPYNQTDWLQGCAGDPGACAGNNQTPGIPNSNLNDTYINQFIINDCQPISIIDTNSINLTVCENQLPYLWNGLVFFSSGTQSATLSSNQGCDSIVTLNLNVNGVDPNTVNLSICENELPYLWNGLTFSSSDTQSVTLLSTLGCDSIVILNLDVNEIDTNTINLSICENELPYVWNDITFSASGTQSAILSSSLGCDSTVILNLNVNGIDTSIVTLSICENQLPYTWNGMTFNAPEIQIINLFNSSGCDSTLIIDLEVTPNPAAPNTSGNMQYCINAQPEPMEADGSSESYSWYADAELTDILSNDSQYTPEIYLGSINYYVTTNENGCESPAQIITIQFQPCNIIIPSAFTPNGDAINDFWEIKEIDLIYPNNIVHVFNRWGNKIYVSKKGSYEEFPWDGRINGKPIPVGTYYYIIEYNDEQNEPSNGIVSILK